MMVLQRLKKVFSTYVEVILFRLGIQAVLISILHVCGGDPNSLIEPRYKTNVFSTYVEVILRRLMG